MVREWLGWGGDYSGGISAHGIGDRQLCRNADAGFGTPARIRPVSRQADQDAEPCTFLAHAGRRFAIRRPKRGRKVPRVDIKM
ncbi:hypothetical protein GCM10027398_16930 [Azotobacter salinestris]